MTTTNPNRDRVKLSDPMEMQRRKQSGDQHILPEDEPKEDPHRPHRISREDMQKMRPADPDPDDPTSP